VLLVVNTPSPGAGPVRDAGQIRMAALAEGIVCLTAIDTALTAAAALDPAVTERLDEVRRLDEWLGEGAAGAGQASLGAAVAGGDVVRPARARRDG
jgi:hypothetical protein